MKLGFCALPALALLTACASSGSSQTAPPAMQQFAYPLALPGPPAGVDLSPTSAISPPVAPAPAAAMPAGGPAGTVYEPGRAPAIKPALAPAANARPAEWTYRTRSDGRIALPEAPKLDVIDISGTNGALAAGASPSDEAGSEPPAADTAAVSRPIG